MFYYTGIHGISNGIYVCDLTRDKIMKQVSDIIDKK